MTSQVTTLTKDGSLKLPKRVQRALRGAKISMQIYGSGDMLLVKRMSPKKSPQVSEFWTTWQSLKRVRGRITQRDINAAIKKVRSA